MADDVMTVEDDQDEAEQETTEAPKQDAPKPAPPKDRSELPSAVDWANTQAALKKANGEAAARRKELEELRKQHETDSERATREATETARKSAEDHYKPIVVSALAKAKLKESGYIGKNPASLIKWLDMEALTVTNDGEVDGLDAEFKRLKGEFPDLFGKVAGSVDAADKVPAGTKRSSADIIAARFTGRG